MTMAPGKWLLALDGSHVPDRHLIGGKAWSLARMRALGLNTPPAIVVTTEACAEYLRTGALPATLEEELRTGIGWLEQATERSFGRGPRPLLVSVRSGAAVSMPGMMDTVLNLGTNAETVAALAAESGDWVFARDTHRRFLELYGRIVLKATLPDLDVAAEAETWQTLIASHSGARVPEVAAAQLTAAIEAVFSSWNSRRAKRYRQHHGIPDTLGTAVTIQAMVFGNLDERSGTGVMFSRNPLTGEPEPYGEYLARAQGEDVVSGRYTPQPMSALATALPEVYAELLRAGRTLERENGDVQDIEFTVQQGRLYLLQTRAAKRAPAAAVCFAVDLVREGAIDEATALQRVTAEQVRVLLSPRLAAGEAARATVLATGVAACQGVGTGVVVTSADEAERRAAQGEAVILARPTTSPEDLHGMLASRAVITEQGGATSHAAVVSRALGVPCIVDCGAGVVTTLAGQTVTVDGGAAKVYAGALGVVTPSERDDARLTTLTAWARTQSPLQVLRKGEPEPAGILDLDDCPDLGDTARVAARIVGHHALKGAALASDEVIRAALAAGVRVIVAEPVLPALLCAVHAAQAQPAAAMPQGEDQ